MPRNIRQVRGFAGTLQPSQRGMWQVYAKGRHTNPNGKPFNTEWLTTGEPCSRIEAFKKVGYLADNENFTKVHAVPL